MQEESGKIILTSTIPHIPGFGRGKDNTHSTQSKHHSYHIVCVCGGFRYRFFFPGFKLALRGKGHSDSGATLHQRVTTGDGRERTNPRPSLPVVLNKITSIPHG